MPTIALFCFLMVLLLAGSAMAGGLFNVMDFAAKADGKADDAPAFQAAIDSASAAGGGVVLAPAGNYLLAGSVVVKPNITLRGEYSWPGGLAGTVLNVTYGQGDETLPAALQLVGGGNAIENIAMNWPEQDPQQAEPAKYPYAIKVGPSSRVENIFLRNPYKGLDMDAAHMNLVRNISGEPLRIGIHTDHTYDISRIENIHFWPYFTLGKPMRDFVQNQGVAFEIGRSDWQYLLNTFCYGYHTGYRLYRTDAVEALGYPAGATNGQFVGIGADRCVYGLDIEDSFAIGLSITHGMFAPFAAGEGSRGVLLRSGNTGNLTLTNCDFWAVPDTLIEVQAGSLNMTACNIHEWGVLHKSDNRPCFIASGGRLNINGCTFNQEGALARLSGEATQALIMGNMGIGPLSVENGIGARAVFGPNNPALVIKE
jgi:hypothetical protein